MEESTVIGIDTIFTPTFERETDLCALLEDKFKRLLWPNPKVKEIAASIHVLRKSLSLARKVLVDAGIDDAEDIEDFPQLILPIAGPSHAGKSSAVRWYIAACNQREKWPAGKPKVLYVELSPNANAKQMYIDILTALKDPMAEVGTEKTLRTRVEKALAKKKIDIVILDEMHNLANRETGQISVSILEHIKNWANRGIAAFVIVGLEAIIPLVRAKEVANRCKGLITLDPLDLTIPSQQEFFLAHLDLMDAHMQDQGITTGPSNFLVGNNPRCFKEISKCEWHLTTAEGKPDVKTGCLTGVCSKLVLAALEFTARRVANDGSGQERQVVTTEDLANAVDKWAIPLGICERNPWLHGPADFRAKAR